VARTEGVCRGIEGKVFLLLFLQKKKALLANTWWRGLFRRALAH
jgi:hypothetical protein